MSGAPSLSRPDAPDAAVLQEIQAPVHDALARVLDEMRRIATADLPMIDSLGGHLLQMRGKMFRPTLALLSSAAGGTPEPRAVTVAAIVELLHLATLVHDDAVDHAALRRGVPTLNAMFGHQVSVIMGDYLYSRALVELVSLRDIELMHVLAHMTNRLTVGEMRQLAAVDRLGFGEDEYFELIACKTASLLGAACETGALCGAPQHREALRRYGDRLGMAFQIADDILDYVEDSAVTGKPSGNDLREHKVTLPLIAALPRLTPAQRERVDALFAAEVPSDALIGDVVAVVGEAGGLDAARRRAEGFAREAEESLSSLPASVARTALADAVTYVIDRRW
ncbi:MAG TPA: polyprenyl synthetase family protein [Gemmatimonadaceae bacterium]|nr:polyprenyl synthetase family protein [Gemmatimonadaceae bacterium]